MGVVVGRKNFRLKVDFRFPGKTSPRMVIRLWKCQLHPQLETPTHLSWVKQHPTRLGIPLNAGLKLESMALHFREWTEAEKTQIVSQGWLEGFPESGIACSEFFACENIPSNAFCTSPKRLKHQRLSALSSSLSHLASRQNQFQQIIERKERARARKANLIAHRLFNPFGLKLHNDDVVDIISLYSNEKHNFTFDMLFHVLLPHSAIFFTRGRQKTKAKLSWRCLSKSWALLTRWSGKWSTASLRDVRERHKVALGMFFRADDGTRILPWRPGRLVGRWDNTDSRLLMMGREREEKKGKQGRMLTSNLD